VGLETLRPQQSRTLVQQAEPVSGILGYATNFTLGSFTLLVLATATMFLHGLGDPFPRFQLSADNLRGAHGRIRSQLQ
jgi:hypothetical protein